MPDYRPEPIAAAQQRPLTGFMAANAVGPLGSQAHFALVAAAPGDASALKRLGTYGFIKGATGFIVGAVRQAPNDLEDYGYLREQVILYATGLGLGTCWLGGTFTRSRESLGYVPAQRLDHAFGVRERDIYAARAHAGGTLYVRAHSGAARSCRAKPPLRPAGCAPRRA